MKCSYFIEMVSDDWFEFPIQGKVVFEMFFYEDRVSLWSLGCPVLELSIHPMALNL